MHSDGAFFGIDLAADPKLTGVARLRDDGARVVIEDVHLGADDDAIVSAVTSARKVGVDVPFGWPRNFAALVAAHRTGSLAPPASTGKEWRRETLFRATDLDVQRRAGKTPLSVAAERIAHPALRWAGIAARLRTAGHDVSPDGRGVTCEVYPGAALALWSLGGASYKGAKGAAVRHDLVERLAERLPWLEWAGHSDLCVKDDNALDAVIAAVVARDVDLGRAAPPPPELADLASEEGWIWLPERSDVL